MDNNNKILEGTETDNLEATSASDVTNGDESAPVDLNSAPTPTNEEVENAGLSTDQAPESDASAVTDENVDIPVPENNDPGQIVEENGVMEAPARTFTQDEVNELTGRTRMETREKTFKYIYDRYGVTDEAGLDEIIGNAQRYDSLSEQYNAEKANWKQQTTARDAQLKDLSEQVALMQSGIDSARYEDAKLIIKGKGLEVTADTINQELATHPEWNKQTNTNENFMKVDDTKPQSNPEPASKMSVLGNDSSQMNSEDSEESIAMRLFEGRR